MSAQKSKYLFTIPLLLFLVTSLPAHPQTLAALTIGDDVSKLATLPTAPVATDTYKNYKVQKFKLPTGNDLSVTTSELPDSRKIVYLESHWNAANNDPSCDLPGLKFGVTTQDDLRLRFGSNGFRFKNREAATKVSDGLLLIDSYEVGENVVTFISKLTDKDVRTMIKSRKPTTVSSVAKLYGISIASKDYADTEWGERNYTYDPNYKKASWK